MVKDCRKEISDIQHDKGDEWHFIDLTKESFLQAMC